MKIPFALALLALIAAAPPETKPQIAITFDDLPAHAPLPSNTTRVQIADDVIAAFKAAGVGEVYGFVNGVQIEREPASKPVLAAWRKAGLPLGNHGWSHLNLDSVSAEADIADIERNEPLLAGLMKDSDWHWFRYPFLAEGRDPSKKLAIRKMLAERHYRIAQVTMSFGDYLWNDPYARCVATGDTAAIATMEASYLAAATDAAKAARADARALYGRDIPYVLLMHIGAFDARMLPRLLAQYRDQGFDFTTLAQAESDPAYAADVDPSLLPAPSSGERLAAKHLSPTPTHDYAPMLDALCRAPSK